MVSIRSPMRVLILLLGLSACTSTATPTTPQRTAAPPIGYPAPTAAIGPPAYPPPVTVNAYPGPTSLTAPTATPPPRPTGTPDSPSLTPAPATDGPPTTAGTVFVVYRDFEIVPRLTDVTVGTTVVFLIRDSLHEPYSIEASFDSGPNLGEGASYPFTFRQPGTFTILCGYHSNMTGTVVVRP